MREKVNENRWVARIPTEPTPSPAMWGKPAYPPWESLVDTGFHKQGSPP